MIFLLLALLDVRWSPDETKYVDKIVDNSVFTATDGKKVYWLRQFVAYEKSWGGWRCVGYLVINSDTEWDRKVLPNGYTELAFHSTSGKRRRVLTKRWTSAETTKDIEVLDRQLGPRFNILFGSCFGNMKDD